MKLSKNARNAIMIGTLCSVSYFAVYVARNILGAVTPQMLSSGMTEEYIGKISSLYFIFYAFGQLINGFIGERIKAKWMISIGLLGGGITNLIFSFITANETGAMIAYGMTGFFLSMIYGPMTKVVSENTEPKHAVRCSLGYDFASFFGSPAAGLLASFLVWGQVFAVSTVAMAIMSTLIFVFFTVFERRGVVKYGQYKPKEKGVGNVKLLIKRDILRFSVIAMLTGIIRTAVLFWLPTYISEHLQFETGPAALIYGVGTTCVSFSTFLAIFLYEKPFKRNMYATILLAFISSAVLFAGAYLIPVQLPYVNIVCMVLAILSANCASNMIWSCYCPSLFDTGMVSGATGFLDCCSYLAASVATTLFANAVTDIGWGNLILVWIGLMVLGVFISVPFKRKQK